MTIRKRELENMSVVELIGKLIWDESNGAFYRRRLKELQAKAGSIKAMLADINEEAEEEPTPDFMALYIGRKVAPSLAPYAKAMMSVAWDYTDPRQLMQKPPDEVHDFLSEVIENGYAYSDLNPGQQNLFNMICHSFRVWWRA